MKCKACGEIIPPTVKFCAYCGTELRIIRYSELLPRLFAVSPEGVAKLIEKGKN